MRRRILAFAGGVAVLIIIAAAVRRTARHLDDPAPVAATSHASARRALVPGVGSGAIAVAGAPEVAAPAALPGSLEGTDPDGELSADADGHLVVTLELRRLFDHFLAASGEEPLATMRARIIAALRAKLPPTAAGEAIAILDRYLGYREAARQLTQAGDPKSGLDQIHTLRETWFSAAVRQAFFADEEAGIYAALERRDVQADPSLDATVRAQKLAEIDARMPAAQRAAREAALAPINEMAKETAMRAAGASDAQITAARTAAFGADAAARLAELDRTHAAWDARLAQFRADRAAILADPALDDAQRQLRVTELLARSFTAQERIRVEAIEQLAPSP